MKEVNFICGNENISNSGMHLFAQDVCEFLNDISSTILKSPESRIYPDLTAFAFWCRKANIKRIKESYDDLDSRLGRGLCFHITPSNIPINFAFSYVFSLIAGNANIVRLPSKDFPQIQYLCKIFDEKLHQYPNIKARTAFVQYDKSSNATEHFSQISDCRMIWGGDKTIAQLKKNSTKARCVDLVFADRYSLCMIDANAILKADNSDIKKLAGDFYNDTYLMDQNACSSPQLICWVNDNKAARKIFWDAIYEISASKYELQDAMAVEKYTKQCMDSIYIPEIKNTSSYTNLLYRSELSTLTNNIENIRGKAGYFYEYQLTEITDLLHVINEKYQTITYFGINPKTLLSSITAQGVKGVDRIVPIGKAMDIDIIWDGYDLVRQLSRKITLFNK